MLRDYFLPEIRNINLNTVRFQQDGATCHISRATMAFLRHHFPGRLISLRGNMEWPPRLLDLSSCYYFLWGYLKSHVYISKPHTLEVHSENITQEIQRISCAMLGK